MINLNETASDLYTRLSNDAGAKMLLSLKRLKEACDDIERAQGVMSYSRVAEVATAKFGGPKKQSVQNNHLLKCYIAARNREYDNKFKVKALPNDLGGDNFPSKRSEIAGLDMKTRVYISHLNDQICRLKLENEHISNVLKETTRSAPLSLVDLLSTGADSEGGLRMKFQNSVPEAIRALVTAVLGMDPSLGAIENIVVRHIGDAGEILCIDDGIERHLIVQRQWYEIKKWILEYFKE